MDEYPNSIYIAEVKDVKNYESFHLYRSVLLNHPENDLVGEQVLLSSKRNLELVPGESFFARSKLRAIPEPTVPYQFSFKDYYGRRGIYLQSFLPDGLAVQKVKKEKGIGYYLYYLRNHIRRNLKNTFADKNTLGVLSALVIGDKTSLTKEVKTDFKTAGVIHVLAVSGLHVGFFYLLLSFFLRYVRVKWLHIFLLALALFLYAGLTGFSASVIRASVMFFFFGVSRVLLKGAGSLNVLFASGFFILLFKPFFLWEPGFQLSFMAVLGILLLYEPVNSLISTKFWIVNKVWSALSVSFVAQLFTAPLIMHYFNELPVYFLISNLVVVFLIQFALFFGVIIGVFGSMPGLDWLTQTLVDSIYGYIHFLSNLPFSKIEGLWLNKTQTVLLYVFIGFIILFWFQKKKVYLFVSLLSVLVVVYFSIVRKVEFKEDNYLAFHVSRGRLVLETNSMGSTDFYSFDSTSLSKNREDFACYLAFKNVGNPRFLLMKEPILFKGNSIGEIREETELFYDVNVLRNKYSFKILSKNGELLFSSDFDKSLYLLND